MITACGFFFRTMDSISSRLVSHSKVMASENSPIRTARSLICCSDSSPEIYKMLSSRSARLRHTCSSSVDLPIPGSPPTNTREPGTIPPPSTWSSSDIPVEIRPSESASMPFRVTGSRTSLALLRLLPPLVFGAAGSSANVFHSRQAGHWPDHIADSYPQF